MSTRDIEQVENSAMRFFGNMAKMGANGTTIAVLYAMKYFKPETTVEREQQSQLPQQQEPFPILTVTRQTIENAVERGKEDVGKTADGFRQINEERQALPSRISGVIEESFDRIKAAFNGEKYAAQIDAFANSVSEGLGGLDEPPNQPDLSEAELPTAQSSIGDETTSNVLSSKNNNSEISSDEVLAPSKNNKQFYDAPDLPNPGDQEPKFTSPAADSNQQSSNNAQFLYSVHPVRGSKAKMDNKDAAAIASLMYSKKGDRVEGGAGLTIRSGKEILFQVDQNGIVQKSAFEERPGLMTDQRMMKAYGLASLKQYTDFLSNTNANDTEVLRGSNNSNDDIDRSTNKAATAIAQPAQNIQSNQPSETLSAMYKNVLQPQLAEAGKSFGSVPISDTVNLVTMPTENGVRIDASSGLESVKLGEYSQKAGMVVSPSFAKNEALQTQMREALAQRSIKVDPPSKEVDREAADEISPEKPIAVGSPSNSQEEGIDLDEPIDLDESIDLDSAEPGKEEEAGID
jgi:hypothetical protein